MPEGDSVYRAASALHRSLVGQVLVRTDFRVPRLATADLSGRSVLETVPRGKHILVRVSPGAEPGSPALTLHSHLMMDGRWDVLDRPADGSRPRWRRPAHTARAILETDRCQAVGFAIQQVVLVPTAQEDQLVGHLGPDLLAPQWSQPMRDEAVRRLLLRPQRPIATALMDQSVLAGIGNIYRNELLFLHRLAPETPVDQVGDLPGLVEDAHRLLLLNRDRGIRVTTGDPRRGRQLGVYSRDRRACLRCGTMLIRRSWDDAEAEHDPRTGLRPPARERPLYTCPRCQSG